MKICTGGTKSTRLQTIELLVNLMVYYEVPDNLKHLHREHNERRKS